MGCRKPLFDVVVAAVKASPYSRLSQNELAMQFYAAGFFNPASADAALACLDMMDFDRKDFIVSKISENARLHENLMYTGKTALELARALGDEKLVFQLEAQFGQVGENKGKKPASLRGENPGMRRARERAALGASPV